MKGIYTFQHAIRFIPKIESITYRLMVEIMDEKENRFQVKYLEAHPGGAPKGSLHWVHKEKVKITTLKN